MAYSDFIDSRFGYDLISDRDEIFLKKSVERMAKIISSKRTERAAKKYAKEKGVGEGDAMEEIILSLSDGIADAISEITGFKLSEDEPEDEEEE